MAESRKECMCLPGTAAALLVFLLFSCSPEIVKPEAKSKLDQRRVEYCEKRIDDSRCNTNALKRTREILGYEPSDERTQTPSENGLFNCKSYTLRVRKEKNDRRLYKEAYRHCQDTFNKELAACPQAQFDQCMKSTQKFW